jgi:hypothetical protein
MAADTQNVFGWLRSRAWIRDFSSTHARVAEDKPMMKEGMHEGMQHGHRGIETRRHYRHHHHHHMMKEGM